MSEQGEHTSEETETETHAADQSGEQSKSEASMLNNQTGPTMLEDEEMPTYISVSSPSRREDSDISNAKQQDRIPMEEDHSRSPYPSDDQGGGSVYVLSSEEESNHPPYSDEEDDEYRDSEDMDEMDLENDHGNAIMEEEEEEDEDDEDEGTRLRMPHDEDDEIDTEYEAECYDRASDDFILTNKLKKEHKERSLSLQDLSVCKDNIHAQYNRKRHSLNVLRHNHLGLEQSTVMYPVTHRKQIGPVKYRHVESKVKQYIKDIKEQSRRSMERRVKDQEYIVHRNHIDNKSSEIEQPKSVVTSRTIKEYAEKALKDLQRDEVDEDGNAVYDMGRILENGDEDKVDLKIPQSEQNKIQRDDDVDIYCDLEQDEKDTPNHDGKVEKRNGSVDFSGHQLQYQNSLEKSMRLSGANEPCVVNGHQQMSSLFNIRSLSYEEYMQGASNNDHKEEVSRETKSSREESNKQNTFSNAGITNAGDIHDTNVNSTIKIENVTSIQSAADALEEGHENFNYTKTNQINRTAAETLEITQLKMQLNQKTVQFDSLRDAYQKTLAENLKMKQELDALKESLAKYENENKPCETKVAAVQTETVVEPVLKRAETKETNNKISTSSVASTISSIDQWTDSACSPAISIKPPDLTTVLNSDDSMVLTDGTPRKTIRPLSRAFLTSSRILQTLSNLTQGKTSSDSLLVPNSKKRSDENHTEHHLNLDCNSPIHGSSSKKRKATDMLGASTFLQPFKIPHTISDSRRRSLNSNTDVEFKYAEDIANSKTEQQTPSTVTDANLSKDASTESKTEESDEQDDNVKCFVYREDESSEDNSFLIQAEEPTKDRTATEKGRIRECGPYLLGNVEVRMSEVNGTISIWGKEISQASIVENEDESEISVKAAEKKMCHCWQKTPQTRFNGSPFVCSTNRKTRGSAGSAGHNVSQCSHHSVLLNAMKSPFLGDNMDEKRHVNRPCSPNAFLPSYQNCDSVKHRRGCATYKHTPNSQEKIHSCCLHHLELTERECSCTVYQERPKCNETPNCSRDKFSTKCNRKSSCKNTPEPSKHLHESFTNPVSGDAEITCKSNACRCPLHNTIESCQQHSKCCNPIRDIPYVCKLSSANTSSHDNTDRHSCNLSPSNDGDEAPLIPPKRCNETPEVRQRRLRGKKVRGILMDLFKGCGDCRNTSITDGGKSVAQNKESPYLMNNVPQIKVSAYTTPEASCSTTAQPGGRCCRAYAQRIESQLEEFRMEMERVRSRSDAILDMLSMLHSVDMN